MTAFFRVTGFSRLLTPVAVLLLPSLSALRADVVINEIMYHPAHAEETAEPFAEEFIELHNSDLVSAVDVTGWSFSSGIQFTFPSASIPPGGFLLLSADPAAFSAKYPAVTATVLGPWTGRLSNSGEKIRIVTPGGVEVDEVIYSDDGDWAQRRRGPLDSGHRGWIWQTDADGGGSSLELMNKVLSNKKGQNWAASSIAEGSPGAANSLASVNIAPIIEDVKHNPAIPGSSDQVRIRADLTDELSQAGILTATVHYRISTSSPGPFIPLAMKDDGLSDDGEAGDNRFAAQLPAHADGTVIEFFVEASDSANSRTWPGPTNTMGNQGANCLYVVEDSPPAAADTSIYRLVLSVPEDDEFAFSNFDSDSNAQMNATFIATRGSDSDIRHNAGVRRRGASSRNDNPRTMRLTLPGDRDWDGETSMNLNAKYTYMQVFGQKLFAASCLPAQQGRQIRLLINGEDEASNEPLNYGYHAHMKPQGSESVARQFPSDSAGNLYRKRRPNNDLAYRNGDVSAYIADGWDKDTNASQWDWSDLDAMLGAINDTSNPNYLTNLESGIDIDQWLRFFAVMALMANGETNISNGTDDDYYVYRGVADTRFKLVPHDLDTIFGIGDSSSIDDPQHTIFDMIEYNSTIPVLGALMNGPGIRERYFEQFRELLDTTFSKPTFDALVDQCLTRIPAGQRNTVKQFMDQRRAYVRSVVDPSLTVETGLAVNNGYLETNSATLGGISGDFSLLDTETVLVNGQPAQLDPLAGTWNFGGPIATALVPSGSSWKYLDDGSDQGSAWRAEPFDDASWASGPSELGYGDGDEQTLVGFGPDPDNKHITTYFRHEFNVPNPALFATLQIFLRRDDGAAVYLNGTEIVRDNLAPGAGATDTAQNSIAGAGEDNYFQFSANANLLNTGGNTLAVEIHQFAGDSQDISFDLRLVGVAPGTGIPINPGINGITVQAIDSNGAELASETVRIWYEDGSTQTISGTLASNTTLTAAGGPYRVSGDLTIPSGVVMTIEPGTTVYFDQGTRLIVNGQLLAEGTEYEHITLTQEPGSGSTWDGVYFLNTLEDNRMTYVDQAFSSAASHSMEITESRAILDNVVWTDTTDTVLEISGPRLDVLNCEFPPTSGSEVIHGSNLSGDDYFVLDGCFFNSSSGYNDIIDFSGGRRPGPIIQVRNNFFNGGTDDCLDLDGIDAHIEGNVFQMIHTDDPSRPSTSNAIATDGDAHITVVRNIFNDVDHALLLKNDADAIFENNVVIGATLGALSFREPLRPDVDAGSDITVRGNIFLNNAVTFRFPDHLTPSGVVPVITADNNIMPAAEHFYGSNNLDLDPAFVDAAAGDFRLLPDSPARRKGILGADMGFDVPYGALISGVPPSITRNDSATLKVYMPGISGIESGSFLTEYRWRLNGGTWSTDTDIALPITLTGLADGLYTVEAVAKDSAENWQAFSDAASVSWTVDSSFSRLVINEVLASNNSTLDNSGSFPDVIELFNDSGSPVDISGFGITDDPAVPLKYVFPPATSIPADGYLLLYADSEILLPGTHLGFGLSSGGEGVYLYQSDGTTVIDSIAFGIQIPDCSIGRVGQSGDTWDLNTPTLGSANIRQGTGDLRALCINEWLASSDIVFCDDFIELYNPTIDPVSLGGMFLTDDPGADKAQYEIPALSYIAAEGFAVFIADENSSAGADHLNFKLDGNVEWAGLYDAELNQIDLVPFDSQVADVSRGRQPDGGGTVVSLPLPTRGISNDQTGAPIIVNTSLIAVDDVWAYDENDVDLGTAWRQPGFNDSGWPTGAGLLFVESSTLPAPKSTPLTLGAQTYYFRKQFTFPGNPANAALSLQTVVDDGVVIYLNGQEFHRLRMDDPYDHASVSSATVGEASYEGAFAVSSANLLNGNNVIAAEVHQTSAGSSDIVFGLTLDSEEQTPGGINAEYERALALLAGLRITEMMYDPDNGTIYEFIELQNISTEILDLSGVRFTGGVTFVFPAMTLAPGDFVLIASDVLSFESKYGTGLNVAGQYEGKLSNGGEEVILQLPEPYEGNIQKFTYNDSWYPLSDGNGYSLEIIDPSAPVNTWDNQSSWRIGALQGTPGSEISIFAGNTQIVDITAGVSLDGTALGTWSPSTTWSLVSGPGTAGFGNDSNLDTTAAFSLPGTYLLKLTGTEALLTLESTVQILVNDNFPAWQIRNGIGGGNPEDDDDCDGLTSVFEYAFDHDPLVSDSDDLAMLSADAFSAVTLEYTLSKRKGDIIVALEISSDVESWRVVPSIIISSTSDTILIQHVENAVGAPATFYRFLIGLLP